MELERLINTGGPTTGEVRLKDGRKPESIAIVHCVGSRNVDYHEYCSRVCCMYSLKLAQLVRDYVGAEVHEYYRDMRAFGKGYEAFYKRVERAGVHFTRFDQEIPGGGLQINRHNGQLKVSSTDLFTGEPNEQLVDMVVLSTGVEPQADAAQVAQIFSISRGPDGFFLEKHPKLAPVETTTDGVYLAGACQGPKDIPRQRRTRRRSSIRRPFINGCRACHIGTIHHLHRPNQMRWLSHLRRTLPIPCH
jgi:heterodisulfide reductase subunit A